MAVVIGETGAKDSGDNSVNNTDTTDYLPADRAWLEGVARYLRALSDKTGRQPSYFFWCLNANSGTLGGVVRVLSPLPSQHTDLRVCMLIYVVRQPNPTLPHLLLACLLACR